LISLLGKEDNEWLLNDGLDFGAGCQTSTKLNTFPLCSDDAFYTFEANQVRYIVIQDVSLHTVSQAD
jgi:hypothetical protein